MSWPSVGAGVGISDVGEGVSGDNEGGADGDGEMVSLLLDGGADGAGETVVSFLVEGEILGAGLSVDDDEGVSSSSTSDARPTS